MLTRRAAVLGAASTGARLPAMDDAALYALFDELAADLRSGPGRGSPWRPQDEGLEAAALRFEAPGRALAKLDAFDAVGLSPVGRLDLDTVRAGLDIEAQLAKRFPFGASPGRPFVVDPRTGSHLAATTGLPGPAPREEQGAAYLDAVRSLTRNVEGETQGLREAAERWRALPPSALLAQTAAKVRAAAAIAGEASALTSNAPSGLREDVRKLVDGELRPALARQADALDAVAPLAAEASGAWRFKGGADYYALALRQGLGLDLSPQEVEAQARDQARRWTAALEPLLRAQGLTQGGVGERLRALMRDPARLYPDSEAGRVAAVAEMNAVLAQVRAKLGAAFADPPTGPVEVRRMSPADEARGRAGYREAAANGGVYYVDLHDIRRRPAWTLPTVVVHETLPGHLLQLPIQAAVKPHPLRLRYAPGYFEGWAVYTETLGEELGVLSPLARIGFLQSMLFRTSRAVADVGVHLRRWSPERARTKLAALYGAGLFNTLDVEVERVCLSPGTGGADAFGAATIGALRRRLGARTGEAERAFHAAVLARGPYPPRLLARAVALRA